MTISTELGESLPLGPLDAVDGATVILLDTVALWAFDAGTCMDSPRFADLRSLVSCLMELTDSSPLERLLGVPGVTKGVIDGLSIGVLEKGPIPFVLCLPVIPGKMLDGSVPVLDRVRETCEYARMFRRMSKKYVGMGGLCCGLDVQRGVALSAMCEQKLPKYYQSTDRSLIPER